MKPHACSRVSIEDQIMFFQIREVVNEMPEVDLGLDSEGQKKLVSCHMLARAIANFFLVEVHDGYFFKAGYAHSWISARSILIDVYPIAVIGGPFLVDKSCFNPWYNLYVDQKLNILFFNPEDKGFKEDVEKVTEIVGQTIKKLEIDI